MPTEKISELALTNTGTNESPHHAGVEFTMKKRGDRPAWTTERRKMCHFPGDQSQGKPATALTPIPKLGRVGTSLERRVKGRGPAIVSRDAVLGALFFSWVRLLVYDAFMFVYDKKSYSRKLKSLLYNVVDENHSLFPKDFSKILRSREPPGCEVNQLL